MKIINYLAIFAAMLAAILTLGCQPAGNTNTGNKALNANSSNSNGANAANAVAEKTPESKTADFSLATPTDAYRTAWAVREKKDVAGMKKVMSKDILDFLSDLGKEDGKSLDDEIKAIFETPQAKTAEVKNEKITGDSATVDYLTETGEWKTMDFEKEGGSWKITLAKADKLNKLINESTNKKK